MSMSDYLPPMISRPTAIALAVVVSCTGPLTAQEREQRPVPVSRTSAGMDVGHTAFDDETADWKLGALSLRRQGAAGLLIGRVTVAERFGSTGVQVEGEAWPRLGRTTYAYLNVGRSGSAIFPDWRLGGELFANLPRAWEASAGIRHLRFREEPVTLLTGSVGKYAGDYWLSLRPFVRAREGVLDGSGTVTLRRYGADADRYLGVRVGAGTTPPDPVTTLDLVRTSSVQGGVHGSHVVRRFVATWALGVEREVLGTDRTRQRVELSAGTRVDF